MQKQQTVKTASQLYGQIYCLAGLFYQVYILFVLLIASFDHLFVLPVSLGVPQW